MSTQTKELWGQRYGNERGERLYLVTGTQDAQVAFDAVSTSEWGDLIVEDFELEEIPGREAWLVTVRYVRPDASLEPPAVGESTFSFDTGGGTQHITQSLQTVGRFAPSGGAGGGATAPDFQGAIGATSDSVEGVDIVVPVYTFSETHYFAPDFVTNGYKSTLFILTGKVNSAPFKGLAAGECLFLGASGSKRGNGDWEISFRFAGSPNRTSFSVGSINVPSKKGWEYLWVRYQDVVDSNVLVKQPVAAYVEKVYESGDFSSLGIGV